MKTVVAGIVEIDCTNKFCIFSSIELHSENKNVSFSVLSANVNVLIETMMEQIKLADTESFRFD